MCCSRQEKKKIKLCLVTRSGICTGEPTSWRPSYCCQQRLPPPTVLVRGVHLLLSTRALGGTTAYLTCADGLYQIVRGKERVKKKREGVREGSSNSIWWTFVSSLRLPALIMLYLSASRMLGILSVIIIIHLSINITSMDQSYRIFLSCK